MESKKSEQDLADAMKRALSTGEPKESADSPPARENAMETNVKAPAPRAPVLEIPDSTAAPAPPTPKPPVTPPKPPVAPPKALVAPPKALVAPPKPPVVQPKPKAPVAPQKPTVALPKTAVAPPKTPVAPPKSPVAPPNRMIAAPATPAAQTSAPAPVSPAPTSSGNSFSRAPITPEEDSGEGLRSAGPLAGQAAPPGPQADRPADAAHRNTQLFKPEPQSPRPEHRQREPKRASVNTPSARVPPVTLKYPTLTASPLTPLKRWLIFFISNAWIIALLVGFVPLGHLLENPAHLDAYYFRICILVGINVTLALSLQLINGISGQFSLGHAGFMAVGAYLAGYATNVFGATTNADGDTIAFSDPGGVIGYFLALLITLLAGALLLFAVFIAIGKSRRIASGLPGILLLIVMAWIVADVAVNAAHAPPTNGIPAVSADSDASASPPPIFSGPPYLIWSRMLDLLIGLFDDLLKLTPRVSGWFVHLSDLHKAELTFLAALLGGGAVAALAGLLVGLPTLRLRGDYLAIATLGFGEIIRVAIVNSQALGGATGLSCTPYHLDDDNGNPIRFIFPWVYGTAVLCFVIIWRLARSPTGRGLIAVREDEIAAAATGINPTRHKVLAFVVGAFFAGVAGALYAHFDGYLNTNSYGFMRSVELVVMVTLGGLGSLWGATIAAAALTILPELLDNAGRVLPEHWAKPAVWIAQNRLVIYALLLVVVMLVRARWRGAVGKWLATKRAA